MLSARSVMGMGGWSRIPGEAGHTQAVNVRLEQEGGDSPDACMCTREHVGPWSTWHWWHGDGSTCGNRDGGAHSGQRVERTEREVCVL